jgi:glutamate-1-semialdehyde aminotransferase
MTLSYPGTFSKSPLAWGFEENLSIESAWGANVRLSDGREYLDWVSGLGSNLLGYGELSGVLGQHIINGGGSLSLPHTLEHSVAKKLVDKVGRRVWGNAEELSVRWAKTGSDVTTMAIRLARAATGRVQIIAFENHYHGWGDWTICRSEPAHGILTNLKFGIQELPWNNELYAIQNPACIILEQPLEPPKPGYYQDLREFCDDNNCLLIIDEIVTGLRYGVGGVCEKYGVEPDLICMGKALGNGLPISALIGKKEYMDWFNRNDPVFCSSTFWGESLGLAAANAVLDQFDDESVEYLQHIGGALMRGLQSVGWQVIGDSVRSLMQFEDEYEQAFFIQRMRENGILMNRPNFPSLAHTSKDVETTVLAAERIRSEYMAISKADVIKEMENKMPRVLFKER